LVLTGIENVGGRDELKYFDERRDLPPVRTSTIAQLLFGFR
jgi:hypothetical protein